MALESVGARADALYCRVAREPQWLRIGPEPHAPTEVGLNSPRTPAVAASLALGMALSALSALAAMPAPAAAQQPGFAFLEVPGGARAAALGGAYASVARGAEAAFWNP